jgi:hypothetical protein
MSDVRLQKIKEIDVYILVLGVAVLINKLIALEYVAFLLAAFDEQDELHYSVPALNVMNRGFHACYAKNRRWAAKTLIRRGRVCRRKD